MAQSRSLIATISTMVYGHVEVRKPDILKAQKPVRMKSASDTRCEKEKIVVISKIRVCVSKSASLRQVGHG